MSERGRNKLNKVLQSSLVKKSVGPHAAHHKEGGTPESPFLWYPQKEGRKGYMIQRTMRAVVYDEGFLKGAGGQKNDGPGVKPVKRDFNSNLKKRCP